MFNMLNQTHTYNTRAVTYNLLDIPQVRTSHFGEFSIRFKAPETFYELQRNLNMNPLNCDTTNERKTIFQTFFANYNDVETTVQTQIDNCSYCMLFNFS